MKLFGISVGYGNSIKDKLYWFINGFMTNMGFILWGGGSSPAAPTSTTVNQTNIPDYAQPYVMNMLNAAQAQIYNPSGTGFNPYVPYSNDPSKYVAGPSPEQQQAYSAAANMRVPGQYGAATNATMNTMMGLGGLGAQMGQAGNQYNMMATNPYATQAFMNPYVQASLAPQLQLANQQYGIAGQQEQSAAGQAGAFGGSREALMNSLNQQNQMLAQNQLISQGYNTAFNNAQQAQQFGAQLGLTGQQGQLAAMQTQLGGANQLGSLGGAQLAAQQGIANQQATFGQQQQQNQQQIINQAVQNYATAQQYPYMQLGTLNAMLRGLPMNQVSTATYMAPPSGLSQLAGLGTAGLGLAKVAGAKDGGVIKASKGIPMSMYSPDQLQKVEQSPFASPIAKLVANGYQQEDQRLKSNPESPKILAQQSMQPMPPQDRMGVGAIATPPDLTTMKAAGGGLLAFAGKDDSLVPPVDDVSLISKAYADSPNDAAIAKSNKSDAENFKLSSPSSPSIFNRIMGDVDKANNMPDYKDSNALDWKSKIQPTATTQTTDSSPSITGFNQFIKDSQPATPAPSVSAVSPQSILANFSKKPAAPVNARPNQTYSPDDPEHILNPDGSPNLNKLLLQEYYHPNKDVSDKLEKELQHTREAIEERKKTASGEALMRAGFAIMGGTSPYAMVNIGKGAPEGLDFYQKQQAANEADQQLIDKYSYEGAKADADRHQKVNEGLLKIEEHKLLAQQSKDYKEAMLGLQEKKLGLKLSDEQKATFNKVVVPAIDAGAGANKALDLLTEMRKQVMEAPEGNLIGFYHSGVGSYFNTPEAVALRKLDANTDYLTTIAPRLPGRQSNYEAANIKNSLGALADPKLNRAARLNILDNIENNFRRIKTHSDQVQNYWNENKQTPPPSILEPIKQTTQ